jgi:2-haloacid dehalogenase
MPKNRIDTIVFDLGGVLVDWDPKYLYSKVFNNDTKRIESFLSEVCTPEWNMQQDAGRSFAEATQILIEKFPGEEKYIRLFYDRWAEMIRGEVKGTVSLLETLKRNDSHKLFALTNWSAETFPVALELFDFLNYFEGIVVSGEEKTRKPFPEIYQILFERFSIEPASSVFIDDSLPNIETAVELGMNGIHFRHPEQLVSELQAIDILLH